MNRFDIKLGYRPEGFIEVPSQDGKYVKYEDIKGTILSKEKREEFEMASRPLMLWLSKNCHPHIKVIVDSTYIELLEGICSILPLTDEKVWFFICKCGQKIDGNKNTDEHKIVCPKCKRIGQVELQPF